MDQVVEVSLESGRWHNSWVAACCCQFEFSKRSIVVVQEQSYCSASGLGPDLAAFSVLCSDKVWILPSSAWLLFGAISATQLPVQIYCSASLYPILGNLLMKNISWSLNRDELRISSDSCSYWSSNEYYWLANILSQLVLLLPTVRYAYQGHRGIPVRLVSSRDFAPNPHSSHPSHYQTPSTRTHSAKSV